jgi:hypothetical protein
MHDASRVRRRCRPGNLRGVAEDFSQRQSLRRDELIGRTAGHALHGNEMAPISLVDLIDGDDVRG